MVADYGQEGLLSTEDAGVETTRPALGAVPAAGSGELHPVVHSSAPRCSR